jgi:hypothetical protein
MARRTLQQKEVVVNNLSVRRATESLANAESLDDIWAILLAAFENNDLDGFEIRLNMAQQEPAPAGRLERGRVSETLRWRKPDAPLLQGPPDWCLELQLVADGNRYGSAHFYRQYRHKALMLDINLLTTGLSQALANALKSAATHASAESKVVTTISSGVRAAGAV